MLLFLCIIPEHEGEVQCDCDAVAAVKDVEEKLEEGNVR